MISALASGFGGTSGAVLSIGASGVDYSYKSGFRSVGGLLGSERKTYTEVGADLLGTGLSKKLPNSLSRFEVEIINNSVGHSVSNQLKSN